MVLHLQYLDPQTPPVVRRWHFYLGHEMICGRQKFLDPPSPVAGHCIALTPTQPRWGPSLGGQPGTVLRISKSRPATLPAQRLRNCNGNRHYHGRARILPRPRGPMGSVGSTFPRQWGSLGGEKTRTELGARIRPGVW